MNRREALQRVAWLMGGTVSAPAVLALLNGCSARRAITFKPVYFDQKQAALVEEIVEIMIPRTSTPGAKDLGIPSFIDTMLKDVYASPDQQRYLQGLRDFESEALETHHRSFLTLDAGSRATLVKTVHDRAVSEELKRKAARTSLDRPFILMTKELTMLGFFTSEVGATQILQYVPVPGSYHACLPVAEAGNGKAWAREANTPF